MRSIQAGFKSGAPGETTADLLVRLGPTIQVDIGLKSLSLAGETPNLPEKKVRTLIDTGAGGDCIDDELAQRLGLPITDEGEISGVGGRHRAFVYTARLYIPQLNKLLFQPFTGVKLHEGEQWHRVILGRSFLRGYRLIYEGGTGQVELAEHGAE
ncbi:retroviral-like aspartic protease family protein [Caulobacter sp. DWR1-3-2b1]|uniref:retroviral-like aspartic protease family protein n=1 Tax=Caulobacter sp. DWR1-3-2b1 TaxID=2804670 RepID=UPI003CF09902